MSIIKMLPELMNWLWFESELFNLKSSLRTVFVDNKIRQNKETLKRYRRKKCRKGVIVKALYAIPAWAFFLRNLIFLEGGVYFVLWAIIHTYVKLNNSRLCL